MHVVTNIYIQKVTLAYDKTRENIAALFLIWEESVHRPTRDIDLLGKGNNSISHLEDTFKKIYSINVVDDGIQFLANTVKAERIKEGQEYEGVRVTFLGNLSDAKIPIQIDVGFGDTIFPTPYTT